MGIIGKWKTGTDGHNIYEFLDSGIVQIYTTADRSRDMMYRYSIVGEGLLRISDNTLGFSIYGNTLKLYPNDGGSPIEFERVIEKPRNKPQPSDHRISSSAPGVESLMKRGCLFLEDSEWKQANEYFDKVLDIDPEYAPAYLGKLCADLQVQKEELLAQNEKPLTEYKHYQKAIRFANTNYRAHLENLHPDVNYNRLVSVISKAETEDEYKELAKQFWKIEKYKNSAELASECEKAAEKALNIRYNCLVAAMNKAQTKDEYKDLAKQFRALNGYEEANELANECENQCRLLKERFREALAESRKKISKYQGCISAGYSHTVGLKMDGTVVATGGINENGQCNTNDWHDIVAISAGISYTVGLKMDGTVVAAGNKKEDYGYSGRCKTSGLQDIVAVAAGYQHTVCLRADGTVVAVGRDYRFVNHDGTASESVYCGQCKTGDLRDIVAISAGRYHTVCLKSDGTVIAVGSNDKDYCPGGCIVKLVHSGQCNTGSWRTLLLFPQENIILLA